MIITKMHRTDKYSKRSSIVSKKPSLPKWLSVRLRTKWLWVRIPLQSLKHFTGLNIKNCISKVSIKMFMKRKTRVGKVYAYRMLLSFKTWVT